MGDAVKAIDRLGNVAARIMDELDQVRARLIGTTAALEIERAAKEKALTALAPLEWMENVLPYGESCPCCKQYKYPHASHRGDCAMDAALKEPK